MSSTGAVAAAATDLSSTHAATAGNSLRCENPKNVAHTHPLPRDSRAKRHTETQGDYGKGGYARIKEGQFLNHGRYEVLKKLGVGHFAVVYLCWDNEDGGFRAVKVIRSAKAYGQAGYKEDQLLTVLQGPQDDRRQYIVSFLDAFEHPSEEEGSFHYCLVFEVLGMSLIEVLRSNEFNGFPLNIAKQVMKQCLLGLSYLHSLSIAHTDIKPENIMLSHPDIDDIIRKQLKEEARIKAEKEEYERLNPPSPPPPKQKYIPKTPGLQPYQIKHMQDVRERAEARKWEITPCLPISSPIGFMKGKQKEESRTAAAHPGNVVEANLPVATPETPTAILAPRGNASTTPTKKLSPPKSSIGISPPPPPLPAIPDSGYRNTTSARSKHNTRTPTKCFSPVKKLSPPLLAKAIERLDDTYLVGAPLERFPSRLFFNSPATSVQPSFDDIAVVSTDFRDDQEAQYEQRVISTGTSKKNSPMLSLSTLNILGETTPAKPDAPEWQSSNASSGGSSAISLRRNGSGNMSSSGDEWMVESYSSFKPSSCSASSTGASSYGADSPQYQLGRSASHEQWSARPGRTPSNNGFLSSSPIATKYGIKAATSTSFDAVNHAQSVFRPAAIPHVLLAPTPPKPTAEEWLRIVTARDAKMQKVKARPFQPEVRVKLADLGNAIFYSELKSSGKLPQYVCTRYYREPGNIIGAEYDLGIDVWALGCTLFELVTGELLFNPSSRRPRYTKEDDLLAQQIELLGPFPFEFCCSGTRSWRFFDPHGQLKKVSLKQWELLDVLTDKYKMPMNKAKPFADFLLRMLQPERAKRATVDELLEDPWLEETEGDDYIVNNHACEDCRQETDDRGR